jgi:uncharacterized protein YkwD
MSRGHASIRGGSAVGGLLLVLALLMTGLVTDHARAAEEVTPRDKMLTLTNQDRKQHDKKALRLNAKLSRYAARHSADMAEAGVLTHTPEKVLIKKLNDLAGSWSFGGENIGVSVSLDGVRKTLVELEKAFMRSPAHRGNILKTQYDHAAIGVFEEPDDEQTDAIDPKVWVTVIFYG